MIDSTTTVNDKVAASAEGLKNKTFNESVEVTVKGNDAISLIIT